MTNLQPSNFNLGLIGFHLSHSLSPKIHTVALKACGLKGEYSLYPISPDDKQGLVDLLAKVRTGEIHGLNVTIPHKQNVIPLLDEFTPTAKTIGAVNTIFLKDDKLIGDNTDAPGIWNDLQGLLNTRENLPDPQNPRSMALILGAGGSARAVVYALLQHSWDVTIAARRQEQAQSLVTHYASPQIKSISYDATFLSSLPSDLSLIVNTTPLGMFPNVENSPYPNIPFPPNAALYDLVYNPRETKLVRDARAAGLPAITGLGMLIEQALLSFEIWTGSKPPRQPINQALEEV